MKVREYLQNFPDAQEVTFIRQVAVKSEGAPGFHYEYRTTAIRCVWEWLRNDSVCDSLVINADHPPIDVTGVWQNRYKKGHLKCAMVTTEAELRKMYIPEQADSMIAYYKRTVR